MKNIKKMLVLLTALIVVLCAAVGGTVAYLATSTGSVTNTFTPTSVSTDIDEDFNDNDNVKKDVKVKNTNEVDVYIRAAVVITWQDSSGKVLGQVPVAGTDYAITWSMADWIGPKSDGYYYYKKPVSKNESTGVLFTDCKPKKAAPVDGYTLHVEIISEAIQAEPTTAVTQAWGVTVSTDGTISKNN